MYFIFVVNVIKIYYPIEDDKLTQCNLLMQMATLRYLFEVSKWDPAWLHGLKWPIDPTKDWILNTNWPQNKYSTMGKKWFNFTCTNESLAKESNNVCTQSFLFLSLSLYECILMHVMTTSFDMCHFYVGTRFAIFLLEADNCSWSI